MIHEALSGYRFGSFWQDLFEAKLVCETVEKQEL